MRQQVFCAIILWLTMALEEAVGVRNVSLVEQMNTRMTQLQSKACWDSEDGRRVTIWI